METAVFFIGRSAKILEQVHTGDHLAYDRVYLGHEACINLMPDLEFLEKFCVSEHTRVSLVTPFDVDDEDLARIEILINVLSNTPGVDEVIVNEWGVLEIIQGRPGIKPVLGRLMSRTKRDCRIDANQFSTDQLSVYNSGNLTNKSYVDFLKRKGIYRAELDNVPQGVGVDLSDVDLDISLYYPILPISFSPFCIPGACNRKEEDLFVLKGKCRKECHQFTIQAGDQVRIIGKGAYMVNESLEAVNLDQINRVVRVIV